MVEYASGALVDVRPFDHRPDGDEVIIGDAQRKVYLAIPTAGLDILNALADGKWILGVVFRREHDHQDGDEHGEERRHGHDEEIQVVHA